MTVSGFRKLAAQMLAFCPFLVVFGVGFGSHSTKAPHSFPEYNSVEEKEVSQCRELCKPFYTFVDPTPTQCDLLRTVADKWIATLSGQDTDLKPAFYEEESETGPRLQILAQWCKVYRGMYGVVRQDILLKRKGDLERDYIKFLQVGRLMRYSDVQTVGIADEIIKLSLNMFNRTQTPLTPRMMTALGAAVDSQRLNALVTVLNSNFDRYSESEAEKRLVADKPALDDQSDKTILAQQIGFAESADSRLEVQLLLTQQTGWPINLEIG